MTTGLVVRHLPVAATSVVLQAFIGRLWAPLASGLQTGLTFTRINGILSLQAVQLATMAAAAGLAGALADVASPAGRLAAFRAVTDHVYGPCTPGQAASWRPRAYADNKSR